MTDLVFAVDPGHGGKRRPGAIALDGTREADLNLDVALAAKAKMSGLVLTRCDDTLIRYETRARACAAFSVNLVICLHFDSTPWAPSRKGLDAYHYRGNGMTRSVGRYALNNAPLGLSGGRLICAHDDPTTSSDNWIRNPLYLVSVYPMDTLLLEMGFLSNRRDLEYIKGSDGIDALSDLVVDCCNHYRYILRGERNVQS